MARLAIGSCMLVSVAVGYLSMPKGRSEESEDTVLYLRGTPKEVARKLKAAAALQGISLTNYVKNLLTNHVADPEKKGLLPKGK